MFELCDITFDEVEMIRELWEKNRLYHENSSEYFSESYRSICFDEKIESFRELNKNVLKITVARSSGEEIGYCISTILEGHGEIASLHVAESSRGSGVGKEIVLEHINWLKENNCKVIGVTVSQENEQTIQFYQKLGFFPNTLYMQHII